MSVLTCVLERPERPKRPRILIHYAQGRYVVGVPAPAGTYALGAERRLVDAVRLVIDTDWAFSTDELAEAFGLDRADMRAVIATLAAQGRCYSWGGLWVTEQYAEIRRRADATGQDASEVVRSCVVAGMDPEAQQRLCEAQQNARVASVVGKAVCALEDTLEALRSLGEPKMKRGEEC